jgi:hypothetical protein
MVHGYSFNYYCDHLREMGLNGIILWNGRCNSIVIIGSGMWHWGKVYYNDN